VIRHRHVHGIDFGPSQEFLEFVEAARARSRRQRVSISQMPVTSTRASTMKIFIVSKPIQPRPMTPIETRSLGSTSARSTAAAPVPRNTLRLTRSGMEPSLKM
jgi:hypothetical protein